jgi:hypothetical protein
MGVDAGASRLGAALTVLAIEMFTQRIQAFTEIGGKLIDLLDDVSQRLGMQTVEPVSSRAAHGDELRLFEDAQVLGDCK